MPQFKLIQNIISPVSSLLIVGLMLALAGCSADRPTYQAKEIDAERLEPVSTEYPETLEQL